MKTSKPISSISYNTTPYLIGKLEELRKAKKISMWAFIEHKPEADEKKAHKHLYIEPAKMIQTMDLNDELTEFDALNPNKPLKCLNFRSSKFNDWYLYGIHDRAYLASKGETRQFHYTFGDVQCYDLDELQYLVDNIDLMSLTPYQALAECQQRNMSLEEALIAVHAPIQQIRAFTFAYLNLNLCGNELERNDKENHEEIDE